MLKNVLIGGGTYGTATNNPNLLNPGEIGIYSMAPTGVLTLISTTASTPQKALPIMIAQGAIAGRNIKSFVVQPKATTAYLQTNYVAPEPSVWTVGYDGVTSTYDLVSGAAGTYGFKIQNTTMGNPPFPVLSSTPYFQTAGAATSIAIADAILKDVNSQALSAPNALFPYENFAFTEVLSTASFGTDGDAGAITVTNGSPAATLDATPASIIAGCYIRIDGSGTTSAIYKVKSVDGDAIVLETPYLNTQIALGATLTTLDVYFATNATVVAGKAGLRVTEYGNRFNGSAVLEPQANLIMNIACSVNLSGTPMMNNQTVAKAYTNSNGGTNTAVYTEGTGTYGQIFKKELWAAGYSGFINRAFLPDNFPIYTVAGIQYTTFGLEYTTSVKDYTAQGFKAGETLDAIIAVEWDTAQESTIATVLSTYLA